jgi:hypothetical protein
MQDQGAPTSNTASDRLGASAPDGAAEGTCWDKRVTPAEVETVVEDVLVTPARMSSSGTVQAPPVYRRETRQRILSERVEDFEQIPCPADLKPGFVASIQRALAARGYYAGPPSGEMDSLTRDAIARFQADQGQDRTQLTVRTARMLGLWTIEAG